MNFDFKTIDKKYRPVPFWSWNEKLNVPETLRQVVSSINDATDVYGKYLS